MHIATIPDNPELVLLIVPRALLPEANRPATTYVDGTLQRVLAFIEDSLPDPSLSPRMVADAHHISMRCLYKLFEGHSTTVADWIRRRRLEGCRHDLLDPSQRSLPVSAIGARWGLPNPAHFSRAFRAAFGAPPTEYRRGALKVVPFP